VSGVAAEEEVRVQESCAEVYRAANGLCGDSGIAAKEDEAGEEERRGDAGEELDGVAEGGLRGGRGGAGGVETLGAALRVGGAGEGGEECDCDE
jgi:hypothetical protein